MISFQSIRESVDACFAICCAIDFNETWVNQSPHGEPQLGKRGLYPTLGERARPDLVEAMLWLLNMADGTHDLIAIAERSGHSLWRLNELARVLHGHGLLARA
ncbi:MAG: winged helix-turn-helix domain-containing protein [Planctomycetota bacterium]